MEIKYKNGLIFISIEIIYNQKNHLIPNCILDTGSGGTAIDIDLIDFDYNKGGIFKHLTGIGGSESVIEQKIDCLIIDNRKIENIKIEFGDIKNKFGINGFIGNNILEKFSFKMDYGNEILELVSDHIGL
ncbi:MAG: hypothetical protein ABIA04_09860 [Pseudomonadota bacterium]